MKTVLCVVALLLLRCVPVMACELVVMWSTHRVPTIQPGFVISMFPDGTLDAATPAPASVVNFIHVDGLACSSAARLLESVFDAQQDPVSRRRFWGDPANLTGQNRTRWNNHQPLTFTETQARAFITDHFGSEAW